MAAGELNPAASAVAAGGRGAPAADQSSSRSRLGQAPGLAGRLLGRAAPDLLALELLLAATVLLFRDGIERGLVFHEADTSTMFFPVFATLHAALARDDLLLWTPALFTGFPLLAEGQTGVLYPPNWLAGRLLSGA